MHRAWLTIKETLSINGTKAILAAVTDAAITKYNELIADYADHADHLKLPEEEQRNGIQPAQAKAKRSAALTTKFTPLSASRKPPRSAVSFGKIVLVQADFKSIRTLL